LRVFLQESVTQTSEMADLSVDELTQAYMRFCLARKWRRLPVGVMQRQLEDLMLELFATPKATDIERKDGNVRGYRHVSFRSENEAEP
jgi:hypothetical protein